MEFRTAIVDELNCVVGWVDSLTDKEIDDALMDHPEWKIRCVEI